MARETLTSTQEPWEPTQSHLKYTFDRAKNLYKKGGPQYAPKGWSPVAEYSGTTRDGLKATTRIARGGNPVTAPAQDQITDTLSGNYLNSNPYLDDTYDYAADAVTRHYKEAVAPGVQAEFANSGRTGSALYANAMDSERDTLARNLGGLASDIYGGDYSRERDRQMDALGMSSDVARDSYLDSDMLLNAGQMYDDKNQQKNDFRWDKYRFNQERPYDNLARYQGFLGGGYGSQSTQEQFKPSGLQTGVGLGLSGLGLLNDVSQNGGFGGLLGGLF